MKVSAKESQNIIKAITCHLSLSPTALMSGSFYFQKEQQVMESKSEPGPVTVLWLNPIQSAPLTFPSCPSQSGLGEPWKPGQAGEEKGRIEIPGVGRRATRMETETAYIFGLDPRFHSQLKETIVDMCPQNRNC